MNKHIALVLGIIFSLTILFVPFTGAFASSDTSVALPQFVFSLMFSNITIGSLIDVTNYNAASDTSSSDSSVHLPNSVGSYSQINRQGINVAQNLLCLRFTIDNPSSGFFDDIVIEPYINGSPAHLYGTYTQSDNNNSIAYYMFFYIGADTVRVKDSQGQDITPWGIRITRTNTVSYAWSYSSSSTSLYYYNYTLQSQTVDPGEAAELALDIINVLQLSQLSENLGMINTQLDTGNIASMMESMLTYLAQIPNIFNVLSHMDTTDTNIYNGIQTFTTYFQNLYSYTTGNIALDTSKIINNRNSTQYSINNNADSTYPLYDFTISCHFYQAKSDIMLFRFYLTGWSSNCYITDVDFYFVTPNNTRINTTYIYFNSNDYLTFIFDTSDYLLGSNTSDIYIVANIKTSSSIGVHTNSQYYQLLKYDIDTNIGFFNAVILYLKNLVIGSSNSVPSDVQQTTDNINQNATTVNDFQSSTQQSLDQNLNNVPVADYQIQATTGTQYMKAYSEALFNASNGFRIWYMLPLILFVIGMLIRWGIKK